MRVLDRGLAPIANHTLPSNPVPVSQAGWDAHVQHITNGSIALIKKTVKDVSAQIGKAMPSFALPRFVVPIKPTTLPPVNAGSGVRPPYVADQLAWIPVHRFDPPGSEFWDAIALARILLSLVRRRRHLRRKWVTHVDGRRGVTGLSVGSREIAVAIRL